MILCDDDHEDICYEGGHCPLCVAKEEIRVLEDKNEKLQKEIDSHECETPE